MIPCPSWVLIEQPHSHRRFIVIIVLSVIKTIRLTTQKKRSKKIPTSLQMSVDGYLLNSFYLLSLLGRLHLVLWRKNILFLLPFGINDSQRHKVCIIDVNLPVCFRLSSWRVKDTLSLTLLGNSLLWEVLLVTEVSFFLTGCVRLQIKLRILMSSINKNKNTVLYFLNFTGHLVVTSVWVFTQVISSNNTEDRLYKTLKWVVQFLFLTINESPHLVRSVLVRHIINPIYFNR